MPEHTHDPIRDLESFGTGGLTVSPLEPAQVRRLGDRRRAKQRTASVIAAAVVAAVAIGVPVALTSGGDTNGSGYIANTTTPAPEPAPIIFPGSGVHVTSPADVSKLVGTSDAFKTFIADLWQKDADGGCSTPDVAVQKYSADGYALGVFGGCGGNVAIWVEQDGSWSEALATQDEWLCGDLTRLDIPTSFAGQCYGPAALFGPVDANRLRLGMSAEEVRAAGGTVTGDSGGCRTVSPPGITPATNSTLGYLAGIPGKGVVALFAEDHQVTPEGIATGSTKAQVKQAYPDGRLDGVGGFWRAPIDENSHYRFDFDHDSVVRISLEAEGPQDCYE